MGSWAMGRVGRVTGWLTRSSQSWWYLLVPDIFLCFSIQVTFPTEIESQKKKRAGTCAVGQPPFYKDGITIKGKTATFERKKEKRLKISNITSPLLVPD